MERTMKISYNWKCDQGIEIPNGHLDCLEEDAQENKENKCYKKDINWRE